jgi:Protein of unknown function (DUF1552)
MMKRISRRTMLKGLGTAIALPWLEAMMPAFSLAGSASNAPPRRMAVFYVPNGVHMPDWTPAQEGAKFELPPTLEGLKPFQDDLIALSGLTCDKARANGDGPGDHARAMSAFLTGCQPRKTSGADIKVGMSMDQACAQKIGNLTRLPSLEIGCDRGLQAGSCDSGYSCAYSANLSWKGESLPMAKEINPRLVFERLFASSPKDEADAARGRRERYKQSILDFVTEDAQQLMRRLGATDRRKMDEYLDAIRETEMRIVRSEQEAGKPSNAPIAKPAGVPKEYQEHIRLLGDLLVLAFQGDLTRICTFVLANEGSNRSYRFIEVPEGHHDLSHHGGNKEKQAKIAKINRFHMSQFAYTLEKLKAIPEGDGTLLDHCMIAYGSGNGDGNRHNHHDLPILLVGKGGGSLKTGQHIRYSKDTPLNNLWLAMLDRMGAHTEKLGDSTGLLEGLS